MVTKLKKIGRKVLSVMVTLFTDLLPGLFFVSVALLFGGWVACSYAASEPLAEQVFPTSGFHEISLVCSGDVHFTQGPELQVKVRASQKLMPLVTVTTEEGVLKLAVQKKLTQDENIFQDAELHFDVTGPNLDAISIKGSGDVDASGLTTSKLALEIMGSGDIELSKIKIDELMTKIYGSGDIDLSGWVGVFDTNIKGAGDISAKGLTGNKAITTIYGSGDVEIGVFEDLDATIMGSGDIIYHGKPLLKQVIKGSGEVTRGD